MRKPKQLSFNSIKEGFDMLPTAACFFDSAGSIVLCNRQMYQLSRYLLDSDMQYLGEVEEALSDLPDGIVRVPDVENTYRFPDKTVWRFEKTEVTDRYGESYIQLTAADVTELQRALVQLADDSRKLEEDSEKLKQLSDNVGALAREKELLAAKSAMHDSLAACITLTKQYITGDFDGIDADTVCHEWEKAIAFRESIRLPAKKKLLDSAKTSGVAVRIRGEEPTDAEAELMYTPAGLSGQRHSVCRSHRDFRKHLGKRGRLHGYDTQQRQAAGEKDYGGRRSFQSAPPCRNFGWEDDGTEPAGVFSCDRDTQSRNAGG